MAKWTSNPQEYAHVRSIIVDGPIYGKVRVVMNDGQQITGFLVGSNSGNNVGENLKAGNGPVVSSIWGEIRLETANGGSVTLDAMDIFHLHQETS